MKTPEHEAVRWMSQSENDLKFVQWVFQENVYFDKGCFIAQQSGEKALKACLYSTGRRQVIGHSLYELAAELLKEDSRFADLMEPAKQLDRHYIPTRYPNGLPGGSPFQVFDRQDLEKALNNLERVMAVCRMYLSEKGISIRPDSSPESK